MAESGLDIYLVASLGILSVLIVASNCFVCVLVCFNKTLRTYTNWLILSLAVSDILTGGVLLPILLINPALAALGYIIDTILLSGVANICAVTYDRYVAIMTPLHYPYRAPKLFKRAIVVSWLVPVIYSLIPLFWEADSARTIDVVYVVCMQLFGVVVPYIFITFVYVRIFKQVRRSLALRRDYESVTGQMKQRARISADAQVAKVFCIVSSAFLLSWTPILYMTTAANVLNRFDIIPSALFTVSFFTIATSSLVNPLTYAFLKPDFKAAIRNLCRKNSRRKNSRAETVPVQPVSTPGGTDKNTKHQGQTLANTEDKSPVVYDTYL